MKEIVAVIRPSRAGLTKQKLGERGFPAYTETRVSGRGKQGGLQYGREGLEGAGGIPFLPKRMLTVMVTDDSVPAVLQILTETNQTGEIGDGKIFVSPADDAVRIRTDEKSEAALR